MEDGRCESVCMDLGRRPCKALKCPGVSIRKESGGAGKRGYGMLMIGRDVEGQPVWEEMHVIVTWARCGLPEGYEEKISANRKEQLEKVGNAVNAQGPWRWCEREPPWRVRQAVVCVLHACGNSRCVNPLHMAWGDKSRNARDRVAMKRRQRRVAVAPSFAGQQPLFIRRWPR
jgi:hypothetical protein